MKCVVQRVRRASVTVDGSVVGSIDHGLLVLVGITHTDTGAEVDWMADKLLSLRVFSDAEGKMNLSVCDVKGGLLLVSQFTLYGDLKKGTRPSFIKAAPPDHAEPLFNDLVQSIRELSAEAPSMKVETGIFGAMMDVELVNDGPVTIVLERETPR
jgi:D-aminoacyl-tRNA deacylase